MPASVIIAIIIASFSLGFSLIQWISRHRPYIGIVNLEWAIVRGEHVFGDTAYPDSVRCTIKNVGETPAKAICLTGKTKVLSSMPESTEKILEPQGLGVLFPGQKMEVFLPFEIDSDYAANSFVNREGVVGIDSLISYKGILLLGWHKIRWHRGYKTQQKYIIFQTICETPASWETLAGGDYW